MTRTKVLILILIALTITDSISQSKPAYESAFNEIQKMLKDESELDFKRAVFLTENAFYSNTLDYKAFCLQIDEIENRLHEFMVDRGVSNHVMGKQFAIFNYMIEPSKYNDNTRMNYDFDDLMGNKDYSKMFVTKLLNTKTGNCHSLPYLFKILCEEIGAQAYLALGPNHLYIKHTDDKGQWVNVELTNGSFPRDGWVISSLSITTDAIKSEIYMEPLSLKESVALAMIDLALAYKSQFGHDDFTLKCIDTVIKYFPKCVNSYMIKSEILGERLSSMKQANKPKEVTLIEKELKGLYDKIDAMGYKEMPKEQYEQWVKNVEAEKNKTRNVK
jgi:hypothetical protein